MPDIIEYQSSIDGLTFDENEERILISRNDLPTRGRWIRAVRYATYGYLFCATAFVIIFLGAAFFVIGMRNGISVAVRNLASMPADWALRLFKLAAQFGAPALIAFFVGLFDRTWTLELLRNGTMRRTSGGISSLPIDSQSFFRVQRSRRTVYIHIEMKIKEALRKRRLSLPCPSVKSAERLVEIIEAWRKKFA